MCSLILIFQWQKNSERFWWILTQKIDFESQILALFDTFPLLKFSIFGNFIWMQLIFSQKSF
jgi:hypothetical protein